MKLIEVLKAKNMSGLQVAMEAKIAPSDFYQAINGKKPIFPAWRKRISEVLNVPEGELFPEYVKKEE